MMHRDAAARQAGDQRRDQGRTRDIAQHFRFRHFRHHIQIQFRHEGGGDELAAGRRVIDGGDILVARQQALAQGRAKAGQILQCMLAVGQGRVAVHQHDAVGARQVDVARLADLVVADGVGQRIDGQAQSGGDLPAARRLAARIQIQHQVAGIVRLVDVERVGLVAGQQAIKPLVGRLALVQGAQQAFRGEIFARAGGRPVDRGGLVLLLDDGGIALEGGDAAVGQARVFPVLQVDIVGHGLHHGQGLADLAQHVVADFTHLRRQLLADDALAHIVAAHAHAEERGNRHEDQQAQAHAEQEFFLDGETAEQRHGRP